MQHSALCAAGGNYMTSPIWNYSDWKLFHANKPLACQPRQMHHNPIVASDTRKMVFDENRIYQIDKILLFTVTSIKGQQKRIKVKKISTSVSHNQSGLRQIKFFLHLA